MMEYQKLKEKNGNVVEVNAFHGSSATKPSCIYNGEEGFDMRFSNKGYFGIGIYFSETAKYSNNGYYYQGDSADNTRQLFLAKLLVGETCELPTKDEELRLPPIKTTKSSIPFEIERYDSVTSIIKDSRIYIVYSNSRAYPAYLISYKFLPTP